jgi:Cof subfamily protein (haloacid dehalogenase superfamily)
MPFRALAIDLDGTLLSPDERVSERNLRALEAAVAAGMEPIIATARWYQLAEEVARQVGGTLVIACSGAQVRRLTDRHDLLDLRLPAGFARDLFSICDAHRCVATIALDEEVILKLDGRPDPADMPAGMTYTPSLAEAAGTRLPRVALIQGTAVTEVIVDQLADEWSEHVRFVDSLSSRGKRILTLTAAGADKGVALAVACADLGIHTDEVIAFGDADNDIEMFRVAGASVAMGQASEHLKSLATAVTLPNTQDGVAVALEAFLERGEVVSV